MPYKAPAPFFRSPPRKGPSPGVSTAPGRFLFRGPRNAGPPPAAASPGGRGVRRERGLPPFFPLSTAPGSSFIVNWVRPLFLPHCTAKKRSKMGSPLSLKGAPASGGHFFPLPQASPRKGAARRPAISCGKLSRGRIFPPFFFPFSPFFIFKIWKIK